MSDLKTYRVEVVSPRGLSGDTVVLRASTPENAMKRARAHWKGTRFYDGTMTAEEAPND